MDAFEALCNNLEPLAKAAGLTHAQFDRLTVPEFARSGQVEVVIGDERRMVDWHRYGHGPEHLGGWRADSGASPADVKMLSLIMRLKNASAVRVDGEFERLIRGGGKGATVVDGRPRRLPDDARRLLAYNIGFHLAPFIGKDKGRVAPDAGTSPLDMEALAAGAAARGNTDRTAVAGRDPAGEGTTARLSATAWGGAQVIRTIARLENRDLRRSSVALIGFGEVGGHLFHELHGETGFRYLTDRDGAFETSPRFDPAGLHQWAMNGGRLAEYGGLLDVDPDRVLYSAVDYLVLAGVGPMIDRSNGHQIRARNVVAFANDAVTPEGAECLSANGVRPWSPITVSGGGGLVSELETRYGHDLSCDWARSLVRRSVEQTVVQCDAEATLSGVSPWTAGTLLAIKRIAETGQLDQPPRQWS